MPRLTKRTVDAAQPGGADVFLWDSDLPGFGVKVTPAGRKVWLVRYRNAAGRQRKVTLGRCCDLTAEQARDAARQVFGAVAGGADPAGDLQAYRAAPTVADLAARYMADHAGKHKKPASRESDARLWRLHVLPRWADRKVASIELQDVQRLHGDLSATPTLANRAVALVSKALNLAEGWGWRPMNSNPCRHVRRYKEQPAGAIMRPDQLATLGAAMREAVEARASHAHLVPFVRLLLLTGCRESELRTARWEWVDRDAGVLRLPDAKAGARDVALPPLALALLDELAGRRVTYRGNVVPLADASPWLFPGAKPDRPMARPTRAWKRLLAAAGLPLSFRLHDLRHTVGSHGHRGGLTLRQVADMLGHRQLRTAERYVHGLYPERITAATRTASIIHGMLDGTEIAEVVPMNARRGRN